MANSILAKMAISISANTAELSKGLRHANDQLKGFGNSATALRNQLVGLGAGFSAFQIVSHVIKSFADFQYEMAKVQAITVATGKDFKNLREDAIKLGSSYGYTSKQVATLQLEFGRIGFSTKEILNSSKATVLLAKATGEDLALSAQIAGSTLRSFNLDASEMGRITDVMAAAFNKSALSLSDFGEAIKYIAPVAAAAGLSLEQTSAMLGVLADNGIKGSMAGTSLRKIISDLGQGAAPILTKKLQEMARAGLSSADAMDEVGRTAYASLLVLSKNTSKIDEATKAYSNATGELQKMSDTVTDNLIGDWNKLTGAIDGTIQKLGESKDGFLRGFVQDWTDNFQVMSDATLGWTQKLEILLSPNTYYDKWKKFGDAARGASAAQDKLVNFNAQLLVYKYGTVEEAIEKLNSPALFRWEKEFDKGTIETILNNRKSIIERLGEIQKDVSEQAAKGLKSETDAAIKAALAYAELAKTYSLFLRMKAGGDTAGLAKTASSIAATNTPISSPQGMDLDLGLKPKANDFKFSMSEAVKGLQDYIETLKKVSKETSPEIKRIQDLLQSLKDGFIDLGVTALEVMGQNLGGASIDFGKTMKASIGKFLAFFGKQLIAFGLGAKAFQQLLKNLANPVAAALAVAAGIALVVGGNAMVASASKAGSSLGSSGGGGGRYDTGNSYSQNSASYEFRVRGSDLVAAMTSAQQDNKIRRGG